MPMKPLSRAWVSVRMTLAGGAVLFLLGGCAAAQPSATPNLTAHPNLTAQMLGLSISSDDRTESWFEALVLDGGAPVIEIVGTTATVHFDPRMDGAPLADAACRQIAVETQDPKPFDPLPIDTVVIWANDHEVTRCKVPLPR